MNKRIFLLLRLICRHILLSCRKSWWKKKLSLLFIRIEPRNRFTTTVKSEREKSFISNLNDQIFVHRITTNLQWNENQMTKQEEIQKKYCRNVKSEKILKWNFQYKIGICIFSSRTEEEKDAHTNTSRERHKNAANKHIWFHYFLIKCKKKKHAHRKRSLAWTKMSVWVSSIARVCSRWKRWTNGSNIHREISHFFASFSKSFLRSKMKTKFMFVVLVICHM